MSDQYSFYVTQNPPEPATPFGGYRRGRTRANPFDEPVKQSWEQRLVDRGEWLEFKCAPAEVRRETNRIRAAGQFLKVGTEVRYDRETGRIAFRGTEYKPRVRTPKTPDAAPDTAPGASEGTPPPVAQAPAQPSGTAWDWQGSPR